MSDFPSLTDHFSGWWPKTTEIQGMSDVVSYNTLIKAQLQAGKDLLLSPAAEGFPVPGWKHEESLGIGG